MCNILAGGLMLMLWLWFNLQWKLQLPRYHTYVFEWLLTIFVTFSFKKIKYHSVTQEWALLCYCKASLAFAFINVFHFSGSMLDMWNDWALVHLLKLSGITIAVLVEAYESIWGSVCLFLKQFWWAIDPHVCWVWVPYSIHISREYASLQQLKYYYEHQLKIKKN